MSTNLVIVESPAKAGTITKYLNSSEALKSYGKFVVLASYGHVRDLPSKRLGIDIDHGFELEYEFLSDKKDVLHKIKKAAKDASEIYLASDADDEGAAISESIRVALKLGENYKRITFNEITPSALEYAIKHPMKIDQKQLQCQITRRTLDRLVGYKLSPLLWKTFSSGSIKLSAGRVQSAVMHLIIQREKEISNFKSSSYWHLHGNFTLSINKDKTELEEVNFYKDSVIYKTEDRKNIPILLNSFKNKWYISEFKTRTSKQNPDPPFITTSLQQEASSKLRMGIKRIMAVAQELYESGYITYMRTDSYNMSETFKDQAKVYIINNYGDQYYDGGILRKKTVKGAQEAHECIRITDVKLTDLPTKFGKDHKDLYKLIWQRSIAFLLKPAEFDELDILIKDQNMAKNMYFKTTFKRVKFNGYLVVYDIKIEKTDFTNYVKALNDNNYTISCKQIYVKNTWQSPPAHYNDAGLVKLMESNGIGRPSTLSTVIEKLFSKMYVTKTDIKGIEQDTMDYLYNPSTKSIKEIKGKTFVGAEQSKIKPTEIGIQIDEYLSQHFSYITDKDFTAHMEADLDKISEGKTTRLAILKMFWSTLSKDLDGEINKKEQKKTVQTESRQVKVGNKVYTIRIGPYGPLAEYINDTTGKKAYLGLKGYLQLVKKEYLDVDENDIKVMLDMPKVMGKIDNKEVTLQFGPYGAYLRYDNKNIKIPKFALKEFAKSMSFTKEQLQTFIDYHLNKLPSK